MNYAQLESVAQAMVAPGKGILAADESTGTMTKRLDSIGVESTEETRRLFRNLMLTTEGYEEYISGVILYDETMRQKADDGTQFPALLKSKGVLPGIKPDKSTHPLPGFPGEKVTEGLDGLRERLAEYHDLGAEFAKWRAVIYIGDGIPTRTALEANAEAMARYAALCQEQELVPIVEPEVLMDGDHSIERCAEVTEETLSIFFRRLKEHRVHLEGSILKPNMVISGKGHPKQASAEEIAEWTVTVFKRVVPAAVPGIVFLSGGQSAVQATENLNVMNKMFDDLPWELSFSYGRALQQPSLSAWVGKEENVPAAQAAFHHRAQCNGAARFGEYTPEMEEPQPA